MKDWIGWILELCPEIAEWQAELIAEQVQKAVEAEREACAKVCEVHGSMAKHAVWMAEECAALIRARGNDD